jgi:hypothetical protein
LIERRGSGRGRIGRHARRAGGFCRRFPRQLPFEFPHGAEKALLEILQPDVAGFDRNENQIEAARQLVPAETERLAQEALEAVAEDGVSVLSGYAQSDAQVVTLVGSCKDRQMRTASDAAQGVDPGEIDPSPQVLVLAKTQAAHGESLGERFVNEEFNDNARVSEP